MKWALAGGFLFLAWQAYSHRKSKRTVTAECCHMGDSR